MILELLEIFVLLLLTVVIWQNLKKPSNYPPGPWGLPLIGSLPSSLEDFFSKIKELGKQNDIISWRIGTNLVVFLFDYNLIKEAYQNPLLADRPEVRSVTYIQEGPVQGIILAHGDLWRANRRFALKHLRDFGMGKPKLLADAHFESDNLIIEFKKQVGKSAPISQALMISILNIVWQIVASKSYNYDDENIIKFCNLIHDSHVHGSKLILLDAFPWVKKVVPEFLLNKFFNFDIQTELSNKIKSYFMIRINEHLQDVDENNPRDYIDAYLIEMKKQESNPDSTMTLDDLAACVSDLFEGATETTSLSIQWAILYLAKFLDVQKRLQKEIDEFLPKGTSFSMNDKIRLPYTDAFLHELMRYSSVVPEPVRQAITDMKIGDYFIPKGATVTYHGLLVHNDSRYYDSPKEFRPERFLDLEGKFSPPKDGFVPFGSGKRVCIGENIARMELFVFLTKLVQNFHFEYPPGEEFNLEGVVSPFFRPPKGSPNVIITLR